MQELNIVLAILQIATIVLTIFLIPIVGMWIDGKIAKAISKLDDKFRSLIILKSNISKSNVEIPMYFNGACSLIREMPSLNETEKLNYLYKNLI